MELKIRRAVASDCMQVFELSNDPLVRANSVNSNTIKLEEHVLWFNNKIADPDCEYYIVEDGSGTFVGQVRLDNTAGGVYIGVSIVEGFRGRALGRGIIGLATEASSYQFINAKIKKVNIASYKAFISAGYEYVSGDEQYDILAYSKKIDDNE